jgi:hypothetical protein
VLRELGGLERSLTRSDLYAPFHVVNVAQLSGPLTPEVLHSVLDHLQQRHALLNVSIQRERRRYWFAPAGLRLIPLEVLPRTGDSDWLRAVEAELGRRIPVNTGPLLRCLFLAPGESGKSEIVLTYHHSIMDAAASVSLWQELLDSCRQLMAGQALEGAASADIPPPLEQLVPPDFRGWRRTVSLARYGLAQLADEVSFQLRMLGKPRPRVREGGRGRVFSLTLEPSLVDALAYRCRQKGITVNSALNAAMLLAVNRYLYARRPLLMRMFSFADLRPSLVAPLPKAALGVYISLLRFTAAVSGSVDFWDLAARLHRDIYHALTSGDKFSGPRMTEMMVGLLTRTRAMRFANTALSYGGVLPLQSRYGSLELLGLHAFVAPIDLSPELGSNAQIFDDRLIWDLVYRDNDMDSPTAEAIAEELTAILRAAAA